MYCFRINDLNCTNHSGNHDKTYLHECFGFKLTVYNTYKINTWIKRKFSKIYYNTKEWSINMDDDRREEWYTSIGLNYLQKI